MKRLTSVLETLRFPSFPSMIESLKDPMTVSWHSETPSGAEVASWATRLAGSRPVEG